MPHERAAGNGEGAGGVEGARLTECGAKTGPPGGREDISLFLERLTPAQQHFGAFALPNCAIICPVHEAKRKISVHDSGSPEGQR